MSHQVLLGFLAIAVPATSVDAALPGGAPSILTAARAAAGRDWARAGEISAVGIEHTQGLEGRWRLAIDRRHGRVRQSSDFPVFSVAEFWDSSRHLRQSQSGAVHALDSSFARAAATTDRWLAARGYLAPGAQTLVTAVRTTEHDGRSFNVVAATPPHGQTIELWFDRNTHLLARTQREMSVYTEIVDYSDYRDVDGIKLPFAMAYDLGQPANIDRVSVSAYTIRRRPRELDFRAPRTPLDTVVAGAGVRVPFEYRGSVIVEAKLNGKGPFPFIFDTGGDSTLTPQTAAALGLTPLGAGSMGGAGEGVIAQQYVRIKRLKIGGATLADQSFSVVPFDYDTVERDPRPPIAGILGLAILQRLDVRIDYRRRTLTLSAPRRPHYHGQGVRTPFVFGDDIPLVEARFEGKHGLFAIDTGNAGNLIIQGRWAIANGFGGQMERAKPSTVSGSGGISQVWTGGGGELEIGGLRLENLTTTWALDKYGAFSSRTEAGNIGAEVLANFSVEFDYANEAIWFEPVPGWSPPPRLAIGATISKNERADFTVDSVRPGSPAAEAGLATGDKIVAVNGTPATDLDRWRISQILIGAVGRTVTLTISRAGNVRNMLLTIVASPE